MSLPESEAWPYGARLESPGEQLGGQTGAGAGTEETSNQPVSWGMQRLLELGFYYLHGKPLTDSPLCCCGLCSPLHCPCPPLACEALLALGILAAAAAKAPTTGWFCRPSLVLLQQRGSSHGKGPQSSVTRCIHWL